MAKPSSAIAVNVQRIPFPDRPQGAAILQIIARARRRATVSVAAYAGHSCVAAVETRGAQIPQMAMDDPAFPLPPPPPPFKGRGALSNPEGRFEQTVHRPEDDGWAREEDNDTPRPATTVTVERARSIISRNDSPDVPFEQSINPYKGCEHGCVYCFARPSHAYLNLSPGLDFETRLYAKTNAAEQLAKELARPGYRCMPINLGANTDPYQPIEKRYEITRSILQVLAEAKHPCTIVTKNALVERDLDILVPMAQRQQVYVFVSCAQLDNRLASKLEPRASAPHRRVRAIKTLNEAGVPHAVCW